MSRGANERIGAVVRVRRILERRALGGVAEGQQALREADGVVEDRRQAHLARPTGPVELDATTLRALQLQGLGSHELVEAAEGARAVAEHRVEELRRAWSLASVRRKSVERLAERRAHEEAAAAERAAARALDELVLQRRERR